MVVGEAGVIDGELTGSIVGVGEKVGVVDVELIGSMVVEEVGVVDRVW